MAEYSIEWNIRLEAANPEEAAKTALKWLQDPQSACNVFEVYDQTGRKTEVDLGAESQGN